MNYVIITPIKNENGNIDRTIDSVINQTILPLEWIIIDDDSTDGSEITIKKASENWPWIKVYKPEKYSLQDYSSRVVHLFNFGYQKITTKTDYISKLDADVSFKPDFFKNILKAFELNSKLGIASGHLTINNIPERLPNTPFVCTRGATKVYRIDCLNQIGGITCFQGWDTLDNVAARAKNWEVSILPEYFEHLKEEGSMVGNRCYSSYRTGFYNGAIPYIFTYFILKALSKLFQKPYLIGSILQIFGYIHSRYFNKKRPYPDYVVRRLQYEQKETLKLIYKK